MSGSEWVVVVLTPLVVAWFVLQGVVLWRERPWRPWRRVDEGYRVTWQAAYAEYAALRRELDEVERRRLVAGRRRVVMRRLARASVGVRGVL